jgi:non-canonical purine NTP pyrophosphatase (RdgB/HAM1 family)
MKDVVFVTGNAHKAKYLSEMLGFPVNHKKVDVPEIQSLDPEEVVIAKAKAAYAALQEPVVIEDTSLTIAAMGQLPGTFIKWFLEELGVEKLCRLADADPERKAVASAIFAYYDGKEIRLFRGSLPGKIAESPKGGSGFGWNVIFIPEGSETTLGEMDEETFKKYYLKIKRFDEVEQFLTN